MKTMGYNGVLTYFQTNPYENMGHFNHFNIGMFTNHRRATLKIARVLVETNLPNPQLMAVSMLIQRRVYGLNKCSWVYDF